MSKRQQFGRLGIRILAATNLNRSYCLMVMIVRIFKPCLGHLTGSAEQLSIKRKNVLSMAMSAEHSDLIEDLMKILNGLKKYLLPKLSYLRNGCSIV